MSRFFGRSKKSSSNPEVQVPQATPGPEPEDEVFTFLPEPNLHSRDEISKLYPTLSGKKAIGNVRKIKSLQFSFIF